MIDPEQEYKELCLALGGDYIRLAPGSEQHLNPFDLLPPGANIDSYEMDCDAIKPSFAAFWAPV